MQAGWNFRASFVRRSCVFVCQFSRQHAHKTQLEWQHRKHVWVRHRKLLLFAKHASSDGYFEDCARNSIFRIPYRWATNSQGPDKMHAQVSRTDENRGRHKQECSCTSAPTPPGCAMGCASQCHVVSTSRIGWFFSPDIDAGRCTPQVKD